MLLAAMYLCHNDKMIFVFAALMIVYPSLRDLGLCFEWYLLIDPSSIQNKIVPPYQPMTAQRERDPLVFLDTFQAILGNYV